MSKLCICVSLSPEAQPIIQRYRLKKKPIKGMSLYANDQITLVKTGVGKKAVKHALMRLQEKDPSLDAFLNIGIAGGTAALGTPLLAHCVVDADSEHAMYPHLPARRVTPNLDTTTIRTVSEPRTDYHETSIFDMEASEFFKVAASITNNSRIQTLKIISDGPKNHIDTITPNLIHELIAQSISSIDSLVRYLIESGTDFDFDMDDILHSVFERCHHSVTEQHRLRRLCVQLCALNETKAPNQNWFEIDRSTTASTLASSLEEKIGSLTPLYSDQ